MTEEEQYRLIGKHTVDLAKAKKNFGCLIIRAQQYRDALRGAVDRLDVELGNEAAPLTDAEPLSIPSNDELATLFTDIEQTGNRIRELKSHLQALEDD